MSSFPELVPSSREFSPGFYPNTLYRAIGGDENAVRHGNVMINGALTVSYIAITEAEMLSFLRHYQLQRGSYGTFGLPDAVFSGVSRAADYTFNGYAWSYAGPPQVEDVFCDRYTVTVTLESTVAPTVDLITLDATIAVTAVGGSAAAANGSTQTLALALTPGEPGVLIDAPALLRGFKLTSRPKLNDMTLLQ